MLKLIPMPNPFKLAFSSYKMTDLGKVLLGSMVAEAAMSAYQNTNTVPSQQTYSDPVQETWAFYGKALQIINSKPGLSSWWNSISKERKQNSMIELFCKEGKGHLVPFLQQHIFPTIS